MSSYIPNNKKTQEEMLAELSITREELFKVVDPSLRFELKLPKSKSEMEVANLMKRKSQLNKIYSTIFRGAGAYNHYIPSTVNALANRSEFLTAYTPYQAEMSQGILQSIFEYQSMICSLTGLDASNASVYDGATACAEAVNMCRERNKTKMLVSSTINPQYLATIQTYFKYNDVEIILVESKQGKTDLNNLKELIDQDVMGVLVQSPNYYGIYEDSQEIGELIHQVKGYFVLVSNPLSFGISSNAADYQADICVGDAQPFGMPLAYGGPYLGYMTCTTKLVRKLPGRIVGESKDLDGKRAFVLTLQAREQHIRRSKATSSICSNQANCALRASIYLASVGPIGLKNISNNCFQLAHKLHEELTNLPGFKDPYNQPFFNEFVIESEIAADVIIERLAKNNILAGLKISENQILWCATECNTIEEIEEVIVVIKEALS